jgi:antitoxin component of RelBE/YafQ-DinJ toxin-antitoxin module
MTDNPFEEEMHRVMEKIGGSKSRYIEMMAAAYIKETNIPAIEAVLVTQYTNDGVRFWFAKKSDFKK